MMTSKVEGHFRGSRRQVECRTLSLARVAKNEERGGDLHISRRIERSSVNLNRNRHSALTEQVGDQLPVRYVPVHPEINSLGEPEARLENELVTIGFATTTLPAILIGILAVNRWYKQVSKTELTLREIQFT